MTPLTSQSAPSNASTETSSPKHPDAGQVLLQTEIDGFPVRRGKVRDIYDLGDRLLIIATDRISAFDRVLPTGIPDKGRILTALSVFWFQHLDCPNHLISSEIEDLTAVNDCRDQIAGRFMLVHKADVVPIECVARGYLAGSGWKEYQKFGTVCGIQLPAGLQESDRLPEPIFTPATKAQEGHDENISFERMTEIVGSATSEELRTKTLDLYKQASDYARERGIILADTKLEWGWIDNRLVLVDEIFTSDSSRFWPENQYQPGRSQPAFDKQFVRDWLETTDWDKEGTPPELPEDIVAQTRSKYIEAYEVLAEKAFPWK